MADNFTELISGNGTSPVNPYIPADNTAVYLASFITIAFGVVFIIGAIVIMAKRGIFKRFFRRVKKTFKADSVTFLLNRDACTKVLSHYYENEMDDTINIIIIGKKESNDIIIISDDSLPDIEVSGILLAAANKVSNGNGY